MGLLLAFLKMLGQAAMEGGKLAGKGAIGLGKAAVTGATAGAKALGKGATEVGKWGWNRMQQGAKAGQPLSTDELVKAFGSLLTQPAQAATPQGQGIMPSPQPMDYDINPQTQQVMRVPMGTSQMLPKTPQEYSNFPPTTPTIPPAYLQMAQAGQQLPQELTQPTGRYPGVFAGLKEGFLGMPSTAGEPQPSERGRQTAYYAGKLIPDIIRSRMGVSTTGEEARQQQMLEAYGAKKITPEYKKDLQEAVTRLPTLDESQKTYLYQQLAIQYPERSAELKRIFFPQSQDDLSWLTSIINAGK